MKREGGKREAAAAVAARKQAQAHWSHRKLYKYGRVKISFMIAASLCLISLSLSGFAYSQAQEITTTRTTSVKPTYLAADTTIETIQPTTTSQQSATAIAVAETAATTTSTAATTNTSAAGTATPTQTEVPIDADNRMTTITIFKIQKQALHSINSSADESWLIDKSDTNLTDRTVGGEPAAQSASPSASPVAAAAAAAVTTTTITTSPPPPATLNSAPSSRTPSVLRPSLEEVASKLSRKHLNLEHDNWRLKQAAPSVSSSLSSSSSSSAISAMVQTSPGHGTAFDIDGSAGPASIEAEQDVKLLSVSSSSSSSSPNSNASSADGTRSEGIFSSAKIIEGNREHYLHIDSGAPPAVANHPSRTRHSGGRRKKMGGGFFSGEGHEISQCLQYLQIYNAPPAANPGGSVPSGGGGGGGGLYQLISNQQLPCSCEMRAISFSPDMVGARSVESTSWLSCDHVQLIGGYLYTQAGGSSSSSTANGSAADGATTWNMGRADTNSSHDRNNNNSNNSDNTGPIQVTRFSQRNSGLQTLHAQKFLNLQLSNLRSIDLSDNRIRQIKMDAFHGLEWTLENLNMANNLLGDSRAIFDSAQYSNIQPSRKQTTSSSSTSTTRTTKLIFFTDEFNRLRKLKWLSLRNNRINQLGSSIFTKQSSSSASSLELTATAPSETQAQSELAYLDLADNLLESVPSDAIKPLNKLQTLNLSGNKIVQLDEQSKFPKSLRYLDLSENLIKSVRHCDLIDLPDLIELNLSHNQLSQLDKTAFLSSSLSTVAFLPPLPASAGSGGPAAASSLASNLIVPNGGTPNERRSSLVGSDQADSLAPSRYGGLAATALASNGNERERRFNLESRDEDATAGGSRSLSPSFDEAAAVAAAAAQPSEPVPAAAARRNRRNANANSAIDGDELDSTFGEGGRSSVMTEEDEDELEAEESNLSATFAKMTGRQTLSEEPDVVRKESSKFNSTIRLNLAYNYFTSLPGDSLLRFPNLQQLDLSHNRIRHLDSNYLCSIYTLVESLRQLDLSGNLLTLPQASNSTSSSPPSSSPAATPAPTGEPAEPNARQLNKLFGCLQKLERLSLGTNRLSSSSSEIIMPKKRTSAAPTADGEPELEDGASDDGGARSSAAARRAQPAERLFIKFGDNHGSRFLNDLDLSDNQLRSMPIIEQVFQQPVALLKRFQGADELQQSQLNQWMASRVYLESLNLSYNYIERLDERDFDHLFSLRRLALDFNRLSQLPTKLMRKFTSLDRASFEGNRLSQLEPLNELFERSSRTLRYLNLANNRLTAWPPIERILHENPLRQEYMMPPGPAAFSADESNNGYFEDTAGYKQQQQHQQALQFALEELNLEGNLLTSGNVSTLFDQLVHMRSLRSLNLGQNLLGRVRSEWFKFANRNLRTLSLSGNKINTIDLGSFAANQLNELQQLNLNQNLLKELRRKTFDSLPKLRELNLAHNFLHTINSETFYQLNSLQVLNLSNNKLTSWKCEYFANLCNSISGNINADLNALLQGPSTTMSNNNNNNNPATTAFSNLDSDHQPTQQQQQQQFYQAAVSSLSELDLSHNSLSQLRVNSISVHTKLVRLNLEHNKLSFIPHDLFKATIFDSKSGRQIQLVSSLKYLNLAHNRIQTIDNLNLRPLRNLINLDLSHNELQTLGADVVFIDPRSKQREQNNRNIIVSSNLTNLLIDSVELSSGPADKAGSQASGGGSSRQPRAGGLPAATAAASQQQAGGGPALAKLRHLNLAHNQLTQVNQSLLNELSPFVLLNLNLSHNYLESESLPQGFYVKILGPAAAKSSNGQQQQQQQEKASMLANYDLVYTLKLESLDLSFNRLSEFPNDLLENHHISMESCNLAHNRIQQLPPNSNILIQIKSLSLEFNPLSRDANELILFEQKSVRHLNLAATRLFAIMEVTQLVQAQLDKSQQQQQQQQPTMSSASRYRLANQTSELDLIRSISRPIEAPYLQHLNLSSNQLVWLAANIFERMHSLQTLDLSNNQLTRLHLLNNQLSPVSLTLSSLKLASNLFTSIDETDFNQLARLQQLDLSSLLSLQKMNCRFLARLTALKSLRLFNFPLVRQNLNNLLASIGRLAAAAATSNANQAAASANLNLNSSQPPTDARLKRKLAQELLMSTIGRHCFFRDSEGILAVANDAAAANHDGYDDDDEAGQRQSAAAAHRSSWFNLHELELELFNTFDGDGGYDDDYDALQSHSLISAGGGGFKLGDELRQLLGPQTRKLTLFGLNLTGLADESLLGITGDRLELKVSHTSLTELPLEPLLGGGGVSKRTKLNLDFRNNNIQSIGVRSLQLLDELQLNNQVLRKGDHSSLRLSSNPIRCDCQTRPLWLWLNQRWGNVAVEQQQQQLAGADEQLDGGHQAAGSQQPPASANYWLKFNSVSQTSDMKCYHPARLRGRLTQHVNYNDLVCKGTAAAAGGGGLSQRQSRKRNETKATNSELSYYVLSSSARDSAPSAGGAMSGELDSGGALDAAGSDGDDYLDSLDGADSSKQPLLPPGGLVRVTKFNRFPSLAFNQSFYYLHSIPVPFIADQPDLEPRDPELVDFEPTDAADDGSAPESLAAAAAQRVGRRDRNSAAAAADLGQATINTRYNKHRPNTQQRHAPLEPHQQAPYLHHHHHHSASPAVHRATASAASSSGRHGLLTDSDVYILTIMSIAMSIMSLIIITICLFKYKMDQTDKERILNDHGQMLMSQALFLNNGFKPPQQQQPPPPSRRQGSSNQSSKKSTNSAHSSGSRKGAPASLHQAQMTIPNPNSAPSSSCPMKQQQQQQQSALPVQLDHGSLVVPAAAQNFLMRSPTVRRMHGLASNASDWFKYTLRAYPSSAAGGGGGGGIGRGQRRRLFLGDTVPVVSQLATGKLASQGIIEAAAERASRTSGFGGGGCGDGGSADGASSPSTLAIGCPQHAFKVVDKLRDPTRGRTANGLIEEKCLHCARLLATIQQTKVQYLVRPNEANQSANDSSSSTPRKANSGDSDKSSPSGSQKRRIEGRSQQQQQQQRDASDQPDGCFVPPSLIRALAEQLDQANAESRYIALTPEWTDHQRLPPHHQRATDHHHHHHNQQHHQQPTDGRPLGQHYYTREQRARSMKTFGQAGSRRQPASSSAVSMNSADEAAAAAATATATVTADRAAAGGELLAQSNNQSQIPTVDVNGRFAYQSDSQIDSPAPAFDVRSSIVGSEDTNNAQYTDGVFILLQDDESSSAAGDSASREPISVIMGNHQAHRQARTASGAGGGAGDYSQASPRHHGGLVDQRDEEVSSSLAMQDECSRSSSPVAYGFMRSSPSPGTTLSSITHSTHFNVNNHHHRQVDLHGSDRDQLASLSHHQTRDNPSIGHYKSATSGNMNVNTSNNNNNNIDNYSVVRKHHNHHKQQQQQQHHEPITLAAGGAAAAASTTTTNRDGRRHELSSAASSSSNEQQQQVIISRL